jgi:hypothetical protein
MQALGGCRLAEGTRKAVEGWGLKLLCMDPRWKSDSLTVIKTPEVLSPLSFPSSCFPGTTSGAARIAALLHAPVTCSLVGVTAATKLCMKFFAWPKQQELCESCAGL